MRITDVKVLRATGTVERDWDAWQERSAHPLDMYARPDSEAPRRPHDATGPETVSHLYVEVHTDSGPSGIYGPILDEQGYAIRRKLRPFLLGQDPLAGELLWERMVRLDRHGRAGYMMMAISAVDCAIWDLRGKHYGVPVYRLLGGPTRESVRAYASCLGYLLEPDAVRARSVQFAERGFTAQKWFFRYGPAAGADGFEKNTELVRTLRESLGDGYEIMLDAFMSWDAEYAIRLARAIEPHSPKWLEEPLPAGRLDVWERLKRETTVPLAAGEHLYTRWDVKPFLDAGVLDFVQADPDWTGGITELAKICAMAATYGVQVVPHGHNAAAALHVIASQPPSVCPMMEYLLQHKPRQQCLHRSPIVPEDGRVPLPIDPGLGIELDESKIDELAEITHP